MPHLCSTLEKWTSAYRRNGFDALLPRARADKGITRVLSPEAKEEIVRMLEKFPRLKGQQVWEHLSENGFITQGTSVRSVQRYDPSMVEWFARMVEERKYQHDSSKEKKNW